MNSDNDFCVRNDSSNGGGGGNGESPTPPAPVASPVRYPLSGGPFALKLYWEPGKRTNTCVAIVQEKMDSIVSHPPALKDTIGRMNR
jgi:hypothetical protein